VTSREVFEAALALPSEERVKLIDELAASLQSPGEVDVDDELKAIILKRVEDFHKGVPGIPADEVFDELLAG
jgi:putative addiction module component (TIGR02574 family)